jgi:hypothetical protein
MSHIATVDLHIKELSSLKRAVESLGLEFRENKQTYKWYGQSYGSVPAGFTKADLGKCIHAIGIPGNNKSYEIGVVNRRDGKDGYMLMWDFWNRGYGIEDVVGKDCGLLKQAYSVEVSVDELYRQGYRVERDTNDEGDVILRATA